MAETISVMCSRITKPQKVSASNPVIFITLCLIENFPFALSCAWPGNYHLKWPACTSSFFFFFFSRSSWKFYNDFNRSESRVFLTTTFFKLWMARRESWWEQQVFCFFLTLLPQNKREKETKSAMQMKLGKKREKPKTTAGSHWQLLRLHLFLHSSTLHREHWRIANSSGRRRKGINFPSCNV